MSNLRLIAEGKSILGAGASLHTYLDDEGNEYLSVGGRTPALVKTIRERERAMAMSALGRDMRLIWEQQHEDS